MAQLLASSPSTTNNPFAKNQSQIQEYQVFINIFVITLFSLNIMANNMANNMAKGLHWPLNQIIVVMIGNFSSNCYQLKY